VNRKLKEDEVLRDEVNAKLARIGDYKFKGTINVRHIAEVLGYEVGPDKIKDYLVRKVKAKVAIHYGCHFLKPTRIREIQSAEAPTILEDYVAALGVQSLDFINKHTCCGAGGGVKSAYAGDSMTILAEKMRIISEANPDFILDICPFCHLQFETGQDWLNNNKGTTYDIPVIHISQLTAYCMGMDQEFVGLQYQQMGKSYLFEEVKVYGN
jgi:heterodisulfide reductase subunit B